LTHSISTFAPLDIWGFDGSKCSRSSIPFFVGLTVVMPLLGHATWHLYRRTVEPDRNPHPDYQPRERLRPLPTDP
jgi:hypothetical protein